MRGLSTATIVLILYANRLLRELNPMTLRQLHYAIFSRKEIPYDNTQADYKRLSRVTSMARRAYREWELYDGDESNLPKCWINPDWMIDETRDPEIVSVWKNASAYVDTVKRSYRRDNWQDQPRYCEVWSEKATIFGSIRPVAEELGITLRVLHGFGSTGMESQIGKHFENMKQDITVFYLGDHDPSGRVIPKDLHQRAQKAAGREFRMERLAIHPEDIRRFNPPPQIIKDRDANAAQFREVYGHNAPTVELDALPADELRRRVQRAVRGLIDWETWNRQVAVQAVELNCIADFADRIKNLPQEGA
jgi:hypothetical protein